MNLKNMLAQIQSDRRNLAHGWLPVPGPSTPSLDHLVGGDLQRQRYLEAERLLGIVLGRHRLPSRGEVARSRRRAKLPGGCLGARKLRAFHQSTLSRGPLSSLRGERRGAGARESGQLTRDAGRPQKTIWGYV